MIFQLLQGLDSCLSLPLALRHQVLVYEALGLLTPTLSCCAVELETAAGFKK